MELLAEGGYSDLTIEAIATRAGVGKATIYRWWSSKGALVGETLARRLKVDSIKDSGRLRDDLRQAVVATVENYSNSIAGVAVPGLIADISHDADLRDSFFKEFIQPRRASVTRLLDRAVEEGALPADTDMDLVMDVWAGAVFYRVIVTGRTVSDDLPDALVALILDGQVPRRTQATDNSTTDSLARTTT